MKAPVRIILLVSLLAAFACLGFLSSAQKLPTAGVKSPTNEDLPLFLNGEPVGSMANTQVLESRFRSLQSKLPNANMADGSLPNIGRIVFVPDDNLSMTSFGTLWRKIGEFFEYPGFARMTLSSERACDAAQSHPSGSGGQAFVLSNSPLSTVELETVKASEDCWVSMEVRTAEPKPPYSPRVLKSFRTAVTSLEVTESGYLLNEQIKNPKLRVSPIANLDHPTLRRNVDLAQITHRPIDLASFEKEVGSWIERRSAEGPIGYYPEELGYKLVDLPIIVAGRASYGSLEPILRLLGNKQKFNLMIVVNNIPPPVAANGK